MKSKNVTHSKFKNTGILFELLVRQVTVDTMNENTQSPALKIMKRYFNPGTELGKELQMYRSFFEIHNLSEAKAIQFIDLINNQRRRLNERKLLQEKYNLIKEIKDNYNIDEFLSIKIPSYKVYASIYKTFLAECGEFAVQNISDVATSKFTLVEHLTKDKKIRNTKPENQIIETFKNQPEDIRILTYKIMIDKFNEKYSTLIPKQKKLLREYISSTPNSKSLIEYIKSEVPALCESIESLSKDESKVLKIKLEEVKNQLHNLTKIRRVRENDLAALMITYQIVEELSHE